MDDHNYRWFATRLMLAVYDINRDGKQRMSVEVKGLADTVRKAREGIAAASAKAAKLAASADALGQNLAAVDSVTQQLDAANAELQAAVGQLSNGGPTLDAPTVPVAHEATF